MAIIGNQILSTNYLSDQFSGDGSTVAFTLSLAPASAASISVYVSGLYQIPGSAYTVSGSTLTFTGAPPTGTNNIYVLYLGVKNQNLVPVNGSITPQMLNNANVVYWGTGNNNVGIGNTTPAHTLSVAGSGNFTGSVNVATTFAAGNTTITGFNNSTTANVSSTLIVGTYGVSSTGTGFRTTSGDIYGQVNAVDTVHIGVSSNSWITSGSFGIGTASPGRPLEVVNSSAAPSLRLTSNGGNQGIELISNGGYYNWLIASQYFNGNALQIAPSTATNGTTFSTPVVTIQQNGYVGIGTVAPTTSLTLAKPIDSAAYGSGTSMIDFKSYYPGYDTTTVKASIYAGVDNYGTLNTQSGYLALQTSLQGTLNTGLKINSAGMVTTPLQPHFQGYRNGSQSLSNGSWDTLIFNGSNRNQGNHYSTSTGVFTAPVAGVYQFNFIALFYPISEGLIVQLRYLVNDATQTGQATYQCTSPAGNHFGRSASFSVYLNANDTWKLQASASAAGVTLYGDQSYLSAFLLG